MDAVDPSNIRVKTFEDLVSDFDISVKDRRKYKFLIKNIPSLWLDFPGFQTFDVFQRIIDNLIFAGKHSKIPKYSYFILLDKCVPDKMITFWNNECASANLDEDDWKEIHIRNFKCTIESKLRSFYFKVFHKAIAFNDFLFKINRIDSADCSFCHKKPETIIHIFSECELVTPLWQEVSNIFDLQNDDVVSDNFCKMFGVQGNSFLTYITLCTKYYIFLCKFQDKNPNVCSLKAFLKTQRATEYHIALKKGKLSAHFKKWAFNF